MKKQSFLLISLMSALLVSAFFLLESCSKKDDDNNPDDDEVSISEDAEMIQPTDWDNTIRDIDTNDYTFTFSDEIQNTNDIEEGNVIVSTKDQGYLRRITNARAEGGEVIVETEFVSLNEVIENGGFSMDTMLTQNKIKRVEYYRKGVKVDTSHVKSPEEQDLDYDIDTYLDPGNKVHLTGNFSLVPTIGMELDIQWFSLQYLDFNAGVEEQLDLKAEIDLIDVENAHEVTLARVYFNSIVVQIGPLPVVITPTIDVNTGIEYGINSAVITEATQQLNYDMGILYENSSWDTYSELNTSFSYAPPQLEASAHAKVYLKPELQLMIYGTVSPKLYGELYDSTSADINATPWWELYAGGEFGAGIEVSILSNEIANEEFPFNGMSYEELVVDAGSVENQPPEIPSIESPQNNAQDQSTSSTLNWNCEDPDSDPLTYDVYFGQSDAPSLVAEGLENTEYEFNSLDYNTTYYWQVKAHDDHGNTSESPVWNFTTQEESANEPPASPELLSPDNTATNLTRIITMGWSCTDPENDPLTYDVYLGQSENNLSIVESNYEQTSYTTPQLDANTTYYWKIVASDNHTNTSESDIYSFTTESGNGTITYTDPRDGQTYETVEIGNQVWFAENLNYETDNSWWYNNDAENGDFYGRLYTWEAALEACPIGWHLPSDEEWKTLEMELGMSQSEADDTGWRGTDQGDQMKATYGWFSGGNGTNSSGLTALPGGVHWGGGSFEHLGNYGYWWSSTEASDSNVWRRTIFNIGSQVLRDESNKSRGYSVRCIKD